MGLYLVEGYIGGGSKPKIDTGWWTTEARRGLAIRKQYACEEKWDIWRQYYRGDWAPGILPSNLFFKMARTVIPRIYFRDPNIVVNPAKGGVEALLFARLLERTDNKLMRRMKVKKTIKTMVQHAFYFGTAFGKLGFGAEFTPTLVDGLDASAPVDKGIVEYDSSNAIAQHS